MNELHAIECQWGVSPDNPHKVSDANALVRLARSTLGINETDSAEHIQEVFRDYIQSLVDVNNELKANDCDFELTVRINRVLELAYYAQNICVSSSRMIELMDHSHDYTDNTDASLFRFKAIDVNENTKYQNFLLYILGVFYKRKYARYNGDVYKIITTHDGFNTHAWTRIGSITDVIYDCICKETNYDQFINVTHRGDTVRSATEFLTNCSDRQFPALKKDRHVFSFKNGIYLAKDDKFIAYANKDEMQEIDQDIVSAKYFDELFEHADGDPLDISTPLFDSIFKFQGIPDDVMEWVYILTGRLIYEIDEVDGWQVIFFVQGQAGTGKSTYANNVCKQFYDEEDVGIMSNNIQKKFGLSDLVDKLLYIAPEIKRDFSIEQGEFQSIISGDKVTINIKCKSSRFENWVIPGVMAGNESPDFIDNAGSIQRRLVTLRFTKKVVHGDLLLGKKIAHEMPAIIQKCNRLYLKMALTQGRESIWTILPRYFIESQQEMAKATNPLIHFMLSENVSLDAAKYIPEKRFVAAFNEHCRENNYTKPKFNPDFYMGPFSQHGVKVIHNEVREYEGCRRRGTYLVGMDISNSYEDLNEDL